MSCGNAENIKQMQQERKTNAPRQLPQKRSRALTLTCALAKEKDISRLPQRQAQIQTCNQSQSTIFARLPREVRQLIWGEALGGHLLHIARAPKRLMAIDCIEDKNARPELETGRHGCCWGPTSRRRQPPGFYVNPQRLAKPASLLSLLQTCRSSYMETVSILYTNNTFDINHLDTIIYLQQSVLPQRLAQIRALNLSWDFKWPTAIGPAPYDLATWRETCDILAGLTGLHELTIFLTGETDLTPGARCKDRWGPLLEALMAIKTAKKFDVYLPWSEGNCAEAAKEGGYPFKLISRSKPRSKPAASVHPAKLAMMRRWNSRQISHTEAEA